MAIWIAVFVSAALLLIGGLWLYASNRKQADIAANQIEQPADTVQPAAEPPLVEEQSEPSFEAAELQVALDEWSKTVGGAASVTVMTPEGEVLAELNKDEVFFAASIYKLYVAYYGYRQVDDGAVDVDASYTGGHTRGECLDLMIRESDSPCAEKLWAELGKAELTAALEQIGITNTSMTAITTTSHDAALMLARIARGEGLSEGSQALFLDSMKNQVYRDALNKGFSDAVTIYNKIGFREQDEYHDVAIVEFSDGRQLTVSVLTSSVGTRGIADLGTRIEAAVGQ